MAAVLIPSLIVPGFVRVARNEINLMSSMIDQSVGGRAYTTNLSGVRDDQFFYLVSVDGRHYLGCDGNRDACGDPLPSPIMFLDGEGRMEDMMNRAIRFIWKDSYLLCKCARFKWPRDTHALGCASSGNFTFAAWDANMSEKYQWDICVHNGNIIYKSRCGGYGYLTGMERNAEGRLTTCRLPEHAYVAVMFESTLTAKRNVDDIGGTPAGRSHGATEETQEGRRKKQKID